MHVKEVTLYNNVRNKMKYVFKNKDKAIII